LAIGCIGIFLLCGVLAAIGRSNATEAPGAKPNADQAKSLSVLTRIPATVPSRPAAAAQADAEKASRAGGQDMASQTATPLVRSTTITPLPPAATVASDDVATGRVAGTISRVVDGDTIDVTFGGRTARVRLIGMDTPETKHPSKPVMCFGAEATVKTQELIEAWT
jgi:hypothetical protein